MRFKCWSVLFLFLIVSTSVYPQFGKLYTADRELSNSLINDIYQDQNSLIWVATEDGLNRYDGSKFTVYKHDKNNPHSVLNNLVRVIFEDSKRRLFIGYFNGVQIYDHATGLFEEIPLYLNSGNQYPSHIQSIFERQNGDILVGTSGQGVLQIEEKDGKLVGRQTRFVPSDLIKDMLEDHDQNVWVATEDKGLIRVGIDKKVKTYFNDIPSSVSSLCKDAEGNVLVGTMNKGLFLYDKSTDTFKNIPYPANPDLPIKSLYLNNQNQIYIGSDGNGMKIYDPVKKKITAGDFNIATFDFSKSKIHAIIEDNKGNAWIGIYQKGVMLLPSFSNNFNYIGYKSITKNWIGSSSITSVFQDHENTLWVGTDNDGLYGISIDGKKTDHYSRNDGSSSVPTTVLSIHEDSDHNLWLGSYLHGMARFDRKTGKTKYLQDIINIGPNEVQRVFSIVEDNKKNLWIGTMGQGIYSLNLQTLQLKQYDALKGHAYRGNANALHNDWVGILLYTDNKLYIGSADGLGCLDLNTYNFASFSGMNRILPGQYIYSLAEDDNGNIWVGSSEGLIRIDRSTQETITFTTENGLPSNAVRAIKKDSIGNLWISTNYGISKFNLKDSLFTNYYASDGLQGNEFSMNSAYTDNEGRIIFGGINGLTFFHPSEIIDQRKNLEVRITDFYIHDNPVRKGTTSGAHEVIDTTVFHAQDFYLSHEDNSFSIEFSAMDFNNPERITYMYSMNDNHWISLQPGTNSVTFNNLSPGKYTFSVKAKDFNTFSEEKAISIHISSPWYFSFWAKVIYFILFLTVCFIVVQEVHHRRRTRQIMLAHEHEEQLNKAKLQLFTNISHEIRTPMSLIVSPLKKLMASDDDKLRQKSYQLMNRNVDRILLLINQLMDVRKIEQGQMILKYRETDIVEFIIKLMSMFEERAQSKNINYRFEHEVENLKVWIDPKNFDKVILNVLSNAFKFTPENGDITLHLNIVENEKLNGKQQGYFQIIVKDSGPGINESEIERVFERFYQVQDTKDSFTEGTGIGLHLTRFIVNLHQGIISAENNKDGKGCSFIIRLPLGKDHIKEEEIDQTSITKHNPIEQDFSATALPTVAAEETKVKSKSKIRVLVVDDNDEIRKYICEELSADYHMSGSVNGKEALAMVLEKAPDLIISDVMMPEMDGITLCRKIKQNVNTNHVPIILLTAKAEETDTVEGLEIGADAYMMKPFSIEILKKTISNIIKNREILRNKFSGNQQQLDKVKKLDVKSSEDKLLIKVMGLINENMSNPKFNVEVIAAEVGISRVHLHRKLKELTNQSTRDLIRNIRLQQAAELFSTKRISVAEVAYAVGFTNLTHFTKIFKEFYGITPTAFIDRHLGQHEEIDEKSS